MVTNKQVLETIKKDKTIDKAPYKLVIVSACNPGLDGLPVDLIPVNEMDEIVNDNLVNPNKKTAIARSKRTFLPRVKADNPYKFDKIYIQGTRRYILDKYIQLQKRGLQQFSSFKKFVSKITGRDKLRNRGVIRPGRFLSARLSGKNPQIFVKKESVNLEKKDGFKGVLFLTKVSKKHDEFTGKITKMISNNKTKQIAVGDKITFNKSEIKNMTVSPVMDTVDPVERKYSNVFNPKLTPIPESSDSSSSSSRSNSSKKKTQRRSRSTSSGGTNKTKRSRAVYIS